MSRCLWPYWMSPSRGTQPPFRGWINGAWLDFREGYCAVFVCCDIVPCSVRSLCSLLTKAPPSWREEKRSAETGSRGWERRIGKRFKGRVSFGRGDVGKWIVHMWMVVWRLNVSLWCNLIICITKKFIVTFVHLFFTTKSLLTSITQSTKRKPWQMYEMSTLI